MEQRRPPFYVPVVQVETCTCLQHVGPRPHLCLHSKLMRSLSFYALFFFFLVVGDFGGFTKPVISNHIFTHLPRSLRVFLDVCAIGLVRVTPAGRRVKLHASCPYVHKRFDLRFLSFLHSVNLGLHFITTIFCLHFLDAAIASL